MTLLKFSTREKGIKQTVVRRSVMTMKADALPVMYRRQGAQVWNVYILVLVFRTTEIRGAAEFLQEIKKVVKCITSLTQKQVPIRRVFNICHQRSLLHNICVRTTYPMPEAEYAVE